MRVEEGYLRLKKLEGMKLSEINLINKGNDGQKIMSAIGLKNDSRPLDQSEEVEEGQFISI